MSKNPLTGEIDLAEIPDTIDDLFRLCTRIVQRDSSELLNLSNAPELVETAVAVTKLQHQDAHTSGMKFLEELFQASGLEVRKQGDANGITTQVCMNFGEQIVKDSLKNVVLVQCGGLRFKKHGFEHYSGAYRCKHLFGEANTQKAQKWPKYGIFKAGVAVLNKINRSIPAFHSLNQCS